MSGAAPRRTRRQAQPQVEPHLAIKTPSSLEALAYFPDGRKLVTSSGKEWVTMWNANNGMEKVISMANQRGPREWDGVRNLAVTRDGKKIICGTWGKIKLWDVGLNEVVKEWTYPKDCPRLAISPDDLFVAIRSKSTVFIHAIEGGEVKQVIEVGRYVGNMSFSPAGDKLALCTTGDILVYDVATGTLLLGPLTGHTRVWIHSVVWSHDGSRLFSQDSHCDRIRSWNANTGEQIGCPWTGHTHTSAVYSLSLSPDGSTLACASSDKTVRFWNATSGDPLGQPLRHKGGVGIVCFSPSGEFVASTSGEWLYVWRVPQFNTFGCRVSAHHLRCITRAHHCPLSHR